MLSLGKQTQVSMFLAWLLYVVQHHAGNFSTQGLGRTAEASGACLCTQLTTLQNLRNISDLNPEWGHADERWVLSLTSQPSWRDMPVPVASLLTRAGRTGKEGWGVGSWMNQIPQSTKKKKKTPLFRQKVNIVNEVWMDRKAISSSDCFEVKAHSKMFCHCKGRKILIYSPEPPCFPFSSSLDKIQQVCSNNDQLRYK